MTITIEIQNWHHVPDETAIYGTLHEIANIVADKGVFKTLNQSHYEETGIEYSVKIKK